MSTPLKAATIYYLAYKDKSSMLFVTGQGCERSTTPTNWGKRFMYDNVAGLDLSCVGLANAYSEHPTSRAPLILIVELDEWADIDARQLQGEMEKVIPNICRGMCRVDSSQEWTRRVLDELVKLSFVEISVPKLKAAEEASEGHYKAHRREAFRMASELR